MGITLLFVGCAKEELDFQQPAIQIPKEQAKPITKKGLYTPVEGVFICR